MTCDDVGSPANQRVEPQGPDLLFFNDDIFQRINKNAAHQCCGSFDDVARRSAVILPKHADLVHIYDFNFHICWINKQHISCLISEKVIRD